MPSADETLESRVREHRERIPGLGPTELARRVGVTRQALHAIETGASIPSTLVALRLARALGCAVEDLFTLVGPTAEAHLVGPSTDTPTRVQLAAMGERLLALPLRGERGLHAPADGVATATRGQDVRVELLADPELVRRTAIIVGCDPTLGLVGPHVARAAGDTRVLWREASSAEALRSLARGEAHAAGIHLWDPRTGESNRPFVLRELTGRPTHLFTLWEWEQGLIVAPGNPRRVHTPADLVRPGIRLVNREPGAGSRVLLDVWLDACGVTPDQARRLTGYDHEVPGHLDLAATIARGEADAGPGPRSAARAFGLDFVPLQRERFDLVVPVEHLTHPAIEALLAVARSETFRTELSSLGGYDARHAGELWRTT